jgi:hypothetical protein
MRQGTVAAALLGCSGSAPRYGQIWSNIFQKSARKYSLEQEHISLRHMSQLGSFSSVLTNWRQIFPQDKGMVATALLDYSSSAPR